MADELAHATVLPQGSMPTGVVEIVSFIAENGTQQWCWRVGGDEPLEAVMGRLRMVQAILEHKVMGTMQ